MANSYARESGLSSFVPSPFAEAKLLRAYIRSDGFAAEERHIGGLSAVDQIFLHAMALSGGTIGKALLSCTFACFDHRMLYVKLPLILIPVPLSLESDSAFRRRRSHLPRRLFFDTPPEGDQDKLQHFFGSACLQWFSSSHTFTSSFGGMLELLEPAFVVGGVNDWRDQRANKAGVAFAILLGKYRNILPSMVLRLVR